MSAFKGFPKEGVAWFQALALAQNREWFQANRAAFETLWLEPAKTLAAELRAPLSKIYGRKVAEPKIFRLNRDVRFSKDKSPYKRWLGVLLPFEGYAPMEGPAALYFHLGLEEVVAYGFYALETPQVKTLRKALLDEKTGREVQKHVDAATKQGLVAGAMESLKRRPPGVPEDHPRVALLKNKGLMLEAKSIPKGVRFTAKFKDWLLEGAKAAAPVVKWGFARKLA